MKTRTIIPGRVLVDGCKVGEIDGVSLFRRRDFFPFPNYDNNFHARFRDDGAISMFHERSLPRLASMRDAFSSVDGNTDNDVVSKKDLVYIDGGEEV